MDNCRNSCPYIKYFLLSTYCQHPVQDNQYPEQAGHHRPPLSHQSIQRKQVAYAISQTFEIKSYICNVPRGLLKSDHLCLPKKFYLKNIPNIESHLSSGSQALHQYYGWCVSFLIGKTPVRIILWYPTTKMLIKACFLFQPLEQEGECQKCSISLCSKVFVNHFYQTKASQECLHNLLYWR